MNKKENILGLFFNNPTKHWSFEEVIKSAKISRPQANNWLKKFIKEKLIKRIKMKNKMPYYIANYENPNYLNTKRLFALAMLNNSGFLKHLTNLPKAKTIILFGSINRGDWYEESDIDLFIQGSPEGLDYGFFRKKLHREIEILAYQTEKDIKRLNPVLLKNIFRGYIVKGNIDFLKVNANV